ncbi:hypothetical protein CHUAL_012555 [Chamberlinius hualienensis]
MFINFVYVFFFLSLLIAVSGERLCVSDEDCKPDECCVLKYTGDKKICRDMGDDIGDACGGDYFCSTCAKHLICSPLVQTLDVYNCSLPANGTCVLPLLPADRNPDSHFDGVSSEPNFGVDKENGTVPIA